jgi:hypothetical protein
LLTGPLNFYLSEIEKVGEVPAGNVWGLALLDNELFIASIFNRIIHVHDKTSLVR